MKILLLSISVLALASCSALIPYDKDTAEEVTWVDIVGMPPTPE